MKRHHSVFATLQALLSGNNRSAQVPLLSDTTGEAAYQKEVDCYEDNGVKRSYAEAAQCSNL